MAEILVIKLGALGDIIMATSLLEPIIGHHANDRTVLLTTPEHEDLFAGWQGLETKSLPRKGAGSFIRMLKWIRKRGFGRVYDLQSSDRTGLLCALSGIPERVGNHPRFPYTHHPPERWRGQCHIHERSLQILSAAGISAAVQPPVLPATAKIRRRIAEWLRDRKMQEERFVLLHAGASRKHPEKRWSGFAALAESLAEAGLATVWIGTAEDAELNRLLAGQTGIDATGEFSVLELAEMGRHAAFAVTNDSGPMHILSASGIPVYGLFGPTNWQRNHAIGQQNNVIAAGGNGKFTAMDIDKLSVTTVLEKLKRDQRIP